MGAGQTKQALAILIAAAITTMLLANSSQAATEIPNELWVSTSTNTTNLGTLSEPYDASTQPLFDQLMAKLPPNCTIHLLSGTYQTRGTWQARSGGWAQVKSGQKIVGSGIDHTTIHLRPPVTGAYWFGTPGVASTNIEVSDLTIDGAGTTNCEGIWLTGDHLVIRRVKVTNLTSKNEEIFPIRIEGGLGKSGGSVTNSEGDLIEDCEVNLPNITWVSGISLGGNRTIYAGGVVRNNRVILGAFKPGLPLAAFNLGNDHDLLVEGNYVEGGNWGVYAEESFINLMIHHNTFKNVGAGVYLFIRGSTNVTCSFNTFVLAAAGASACQFQPPYPFKNIAMIGNTIEFAGVPSSRSSYGLFTKTASGVFFVNNMMDNRLLVETGGSTGVNIYNNLDLAGNPLVINQEGARSVKRRSVTVAGTYLVDYADRYIGLQNPSLISVSLPPASGWAGKEFVIAREDGAASFTLISRGGLINGTSNLTITKEGSNPAATTTVISDGVNWHAR
jgi:hypothetical protein